MNFVKNTEGKLKIIRRFQNLRTDGQTERPTDRNNVTNCGYVKPQLNVFDKHCKINFFNHSWTTQQSISNTRLRIGRSKTTLQLV